MKITSIVFNFYLQLSGSRKYYVKDNKFCVLDDGTGNARKVNWNFANWTLNIYRLTDN